MNDWLPAIAIALLGAWLNLVMWATRQSDPPAFFRFMFRAWDGLKELLGLHWLNQWLYARSQR